MSTKESKTPSPRSKYPCQCDRLSRNNLLKSIKEQAEKEIAQFKQEKEKEYQRELEAVSDILIRK